ncbi:unnamed protein product [Coffea canephora]|uniref:Uncharacterized protein n=1 Tax=Coffea canephora TaxID=49390 RepID=A0A068V503_COFCA|nr:unnamed protein product [Coffea canephora]
MEQNYNFNPSFIKLLMEDDFTREIRIPCSFVRNFKEKLPSRCTIESEAKNSVRNSWPVRIRKKGKTTFRVKPYGADCCPKKFNVYNSSSSSNDGIRPSKVHPAKKKVYTKYQIDRDNFRSNKFKKLRKTRKSGVGKQVLEIESEEGEDVETNERDGYFHLNAENPYFILRLKRHHMRRLVSKQQIFPHNV